MLSSRIDVERAILSAVIFFNGYSQIAHVLTPQNFTSGSGVHHREIMEVISGMYPAKPIDLLTVSHELRAHYPNNEFLHNLVSRSNYVQSSSNLTYWAFILLQIDIEEKFKKDLVNWKDAREGELVAEAVILEIINSLGEIDILELIELSMKFFSEQKMDTEHEAVAQFYGLLAEKCRKIRRLESINTALNHLFKMAEPNQEIKRQCQVMMDAVADMIITGQPRERYTEAIKILEQ